MRAATVGLALALVAAPGPARAQVPTLDRVDSLLTAGSYDDARTTLDRWWSAREEFDVPASDNARGHMLRAQLARSPEAAESDYLSVFLGYPTSDHAPEALLRLGQGLLAMEDYPRAIGYLERLVADYPGQPQRLAGFLWLARAANAGRRRAVACRAARDGLAVERDPDRAAMLRIEAAAACGIGGPAADPPAALGRWTVQVGAFRYARSAEHLAERLRLAGHGARVVRVAQNDLLRVRVGRFPSSDAAGRLLTRLRDQGFDALVVGDADRERDP